MDDMRTLGRGPWLACPQRRPSHGNIMKNLSLIALALAFVGLSGCIAYPVGDYPAGGEHGDRHDRDRDRDRDHRDDHQGDNRDRHPDCDPRMSDCTRH